MRIDIWDIHAKVKDLLGLKEVNVVLLEGVMLTHDFDGIDDYDTGIVEVSLNKTGFVISTIDDGLWGCHAPQVEEIDRIEFLEDFNKSFGYKLPTTDKLNEFLLKYEIYGCNIG